MTVGPWRIRTRCRLVGRHGFWCHRDRFPEGNVYRLKAGLLLMTIMVDRGR